MKAHPYRIVRGTGGGYWNVVDVSEVSDALNGEIVGVSHPTRAEAREALADLRSDYLDRTYLHCPTCGDDSCPAATDADGYGQDGTDGPLGPCPHADA